ncbi:MAG: hypothetical protein RIE06_33530 [Roseibium album]|uniref:hypothetical protein n=1 Tax=Roseibium album TaxID=311410 RepID=UPI000CF0DA08|nr:hypothetical protein [Labrenzia sp. EL_142]
MKAISPNGTEIVAASELVPAHARLVSRAFNRDTDGSLQFQYDPSGSDMMWDKEFITTNDEGLRVFVDELGQLWTENQIELTE